MNLDGPNSSLIKNIKCFDTTEKINHTLHTNKLSIGTWKSERVFATQLHLKFATAVVEEMQLFTAQRFYPSNSSGSLLFHVPELAFEYFSMGFHQLSGPAGWVQVNPDLVAEKKYYCLIG